jgi:hypothetical protein
MRPPCQALHVAIDSSAVTAMPGSAVAMQVTVHNRGALVENARVAVAGIPADWVSIEPSVVNVDVGCSRVVMVTVTPPRSVDTEPGERTIAIAAQSTIGLRVRSLVHIGLTVATFDAVDVAISRDTSMGRRRGSVEVTMSNCGNATAVVGARVHDTTGKLSVTATDATIQLAPGAQAVRVLPIAARPVLCGSARAYSLVVRAGVASAPVTMNGTFTHVALLPRWVSRLATMAAAVLVSVGAVALLRSLQPYATASPVVPSTEFRNANPMTSGTALSADRTPNTTVSVPATTVASIPAVSVDTEAPASTSLTPASLTPASSSITEPPPVAVVMPVAPLSPAPTPGVVLTPPAGGTDAGSTGSTPATAPTIAPTITVPATAVPATTVAATTASTTSVPAPLPKVPADLLARRYSASSAKGALIAAGVPAGHIRLSGCGGLRSRSVEDVTPAPGHEVGVATEVVLYCGDPIGHS